jgi:hypothetical protein
MGSFGADVAWASGTEVWPLGAAKTGCPEEAWGAVLSPSVWAARGVDMSSARMRTASGRTGASAGIIEKILSRVGIVPERDEPELTIWSVD